MAASTGAAMTGTEYLSQTAARAAAQFPHGSQGVEHVVVLMMENRSFDHFLGWLPGADGRLNRTYLSTDGNVYPNYPLRVQRPRPQLGRLPDPAQLRQDGRVPPAADPACR
jgi:phospholipase C